MFSHILWTTNNSMTKYLMKFCFIFFWFCRTWNLANRRNIIVYIYLEEKNIFLYVILQTWNVNVTWFKWIAWNCFWFSLLIEKSRCVKISLLNVFLSIFLSEGLICVCCVFYFFLLIFNWFSFSFERKRCIFLCW